MSVDGWRAWLDRMSSSALCAPATLQCWTQAVDALDAATDPAAARLIERFLLQGAALWQTAEEMHAAPAARTVGASSAGSAVALAQLLATPGHLGDVPSAANNSSPMTGQLAATLSGIGLGALAAHAENTQACASTAHTADEQMRHLDAAIERGYHAHADSPEFARQMAAALDDWLTAPDRDTTVTH